MKYDYLSRHKYKPRKPWWEPALTKQQRSSYYQSILENPSLLNGIEIDEKDLFKHTLIEPVSFDIDQYLLNGKLVKKPCFLLFILIPFEKPTVTLIHKLLFH